MRINLSNIFVVTLVFVSMQACTETVEVDVPFEGSRLVVDASLDWERGTTGQNQTITLSATTEYFSDQPVQPVTGASVTVTKDDDGTLFTFVDQGDGNYTTDAFIPEFNRSYSLQIEYEGAIYIASETMIPVSNITRVEQTMNEGLSVDDIEVTVYYDDPADEDNYYMAEFVPSHKPLPQVWTFDDRFTDGNETLFFYEDEDLEAGDTVDITLLGISESYYHFMTLVVMQSSQNFAGPFQPAPVQVQGNVVNETNPDEEVPGYFRLSEVIRTDFTIN